MTPNELRELIARLEEHADLHTEVTVLQDPEQAQWGRDLRGTANYLRACADAMDAEPVAWMYPDDYERMKTSETYCTVFSVEVGSPTQGTTTVPLYAHPPTLRLPEPMTEDPDLWDAYERQRDDWWLVDFGEFRRISRAIEAEVLRRVKEANE